MSNDERPIEPRSASDQPAPRGGHDFLDLEGELNRRRDGRADGDADPQADSWLLAGEEPAPVEPAPIVEPLPVEPDAIPPSALQSQEQPPHEPQSQEPQGQEPVPPAAEPWLMDYEESGQAPAAPPLDADAAAPLTLEASFCEPEPTSRTVSRAATKGLLVMGVVVLAIGGIQVSRQRASLPEVVEKDLTPVETQATVAKETVLEHPDSSWSGHVSREDWERQGVGSTRPVLRPAEPDELTVWARPEAEEETAEPFELDDPAAAPKGRVNESHHSLAESVSEVAAQPAAEVDLAAADEAWLAELADLQAAASHPSDGALAAAGSSVEAWMQDELRAHAPELSVFEWSHGPALTTGWRLRHPELRPQRDAEAFVWIQAVDPLPIETTIVVAQAPDWVLAEATENPIVPDAPQPTRLAQADALEHDLVPFAWSDIARTVEEPTAPATDEIVDADADEGEGAVASVETFADPAMVEVMVEQVSQQPGPGPEATLAAEPFVDVDPQAVTAQEPDTIAAAEIEPQDHDVAIEAPAQPEPEPDTSPRPDAVATVTPSDLDRAGTWFLGEPTGPDAKPRHRRRNPDARPRRERVVAEDTEVVEAAPEVAEIAPEAVAIAPEAVEVAPEVTEVAAATEEPVLEDLPTVEEWTHTPSVAEVVEETDGVVTAPVDDAVAELEVAEDPAALDSDSEDDQLVAAETSEPEAGPELGPEPDPSSSMGPEVALTADDAPVVDLADLTDLDAIVAPEPELEPAQDQPKAPSRLLASRRGMLEMYGDYLRTGEVPSDAHAPLEHGTSPRPRDPVAAASDADGPTVDPAESGIQPGDEAMFQHGEDALASADEPEPTVEEPRVIGSGSLRRISAKERWDGEEPPMVALRGEHRVLTPNVGDVIVTFKNGSTMAGRLHAVGAGNGWLDTKSGRVSFASDRVEGIARSAGGLGPAQKVTVVTSGGVFVGMEVSRDGDEITIDTDDGLRMSLVALEVKPFQPKRERVGIKRRSE